MAILQVGIQKHFHSVCAHKLTRALPILEGSVKLVKDTFSATDVKSKDQNTANIFIKQMKCSMNHMVPKHQNQKAPCNE